jgi:DNA polymerase III subunit alpha
VPPVAQMLREFPARRVTIDEGELVQGLPVRLLLQRQQASGELDLGDASKFFPTDAALDGWARASHGDAQVVYDMEG